MSCSFNLPLLIAVVPFGQYQEETSDCCHTPASDS